MSQVELLRSILAKNTTKPVRLERRILQSGNSRSANAMGAVVMMIDIGYGQAMAWVTEWVSGEQNA